MCYNYHEFNISCMYVIIYMLVIVIVHDYMLHHAISKMHTKIHQLLTNECTNGVNYVVTLCLWLALIFCILLYSL